MVRNPFYVLSMKFWGDPRGHIPCVYLPPRDENKKAIKTKNMESIINSSTGRTGRRSGHPSGTPSDRDGSSYGSAIIDYRSGHIGNGMTASSPIEKMIKESSLYKNAYQVLSSDTKYGEPFLLNLPLFRNLYLCVM